MKTATPHMHIPIMVNEILAFAKEISQGVNTYYDGTLGRGGHLQAIFETFPEAQAVATDKDLTAIEFATKKFEKEITEKRLQILHADYSSIRELVSEGKTNLKSFDMILLDLGVSSPQIDQAERGFSFIQDGPLDMRMNQNQAVLAADIVNGWTEDELKKLFFHLGEVKTSGRVVRAIVNDRKEKPFTTTRELAGLIERVEGWKKKGMHPATQYFMALRIQVNGELDQLEGAVKDCMTLLNDGGRLFVITFHSLEDRIVKNTFIESESMGFVVNKRVITPSEEEQSQNSRSRSAKLRIFQRSFAGRPAQIKKDKYAHKKGQ